MHLEWAFQEPSCCKRDLEDFARLHLRVSAALAADPTVTFSIAFTEITEGAPAINLFEAVDPSMDYLSNDNAANAQIVKTRLLTAGGTPAPLSRESIRPNGEVTPFLFEGRQTGKGRLVLTAKRGAQILGETGVTLDLKSGEWFYDRYAVAVTSPSNTDPWNVTISPSANLEQAGGYAPPTNEVFLLVHGWNMSEFEKRRWAETAFKRLWWQGYQGRVVLFSWPTLELPDFFDIGSLLEPRNFDNSELIAWRSSPALADLFQTLGPPRLRVMAHSMGNVVTSEALRLHNGPPLHSYIACQAALSAQYFDNSVSALFPCPPHLVLGVETGTINTPDVMGHFMTGDANSSEYLTGLKSAKVLRLYNYYNPSDWALQKWQINNVYKPADYGGHNFYYFGSLLRYEPAPPGTVNYTKDRFVRGANPPGQFEYRLDTGDHRLVIFSYIAESRSVALGSTFPGRGFDRNWGLNNHYGYDAQHYSHSRQFRSNVVDEGQLWKKVIEDFRFASSLQGEGTSQ